MEQALDLVDRYIKSGGQLFGDGAICRHCGDERVHHKIGGKKRGWYCRRCSNSWRQRQYKKDPREMMAWSAKQRAQRDGLPFDLSIDDIYIPMICPVLGIPIRPGTRKSHENSATLDRVVPELGYVKDNIVVISYKANRIRNNATTWELERVTAYSKMLTDLQVRSDAASRGSRYLTAVPENSLRNSGGLTSSSATLSS
jgi:hypothetical protein